jgi:hypothetical protein
MDALAPAQCPVSLGIDHLVRQPPFEMPPGAW